MVRALFVGSLVFIGGALIDTSSGFYSAAEAKIHHTSGSISHETAHKVNVASAHGISAYARASSRRYGRFANLKGGKARYAYYGGLQCVPFARAASGISLKGNAANWWDAAAGVYERGSRPEAGSVLNFRSTGGMRLGHVAVVTGVRDARTIEIEHANWSKGSVSRNVSVVDVSPENDWSQVRVALGRGGEYGRAYPTYGFIYDRPDSARMVASGEANGGGVEVGGPSPAPTYDEVAEMPPGRAGRTARRLVPDPPNRSLQ